MLKILLYLAQNDYDQGDHGIHGIVASYSIQHQDARHETFWELSLSSPAQVISVSQWRYNLCYICIAISIIKALNDNSTALHIIKYSSVISFKVTLHAPF